jgi:hypothetical protein
MTNSYQYVKDSVDRRREWLDSLKKDQPCADCGVSFPPCVMDYHHIDPTTKKFSIGRGSYRNSRKLILEEISKCILVCANCHRLREYSTRSREVGISSVS